jgi:hypothetical protein
VGTTLTWVHTTREGRGRHSPVLGRRQAGRRPVATCSMICSIIIQASLFWNRSFPGIGSLSDVFTLMYNCFEPASAIFLFWLFAIPILRTVLFLRWCYSTNLVYKSCGMYRARMGALRTHCMFGVGYYGILGGCLWR